MTDISGKKPTWAGRILGQMFVFVFCVLFPGGVTAIAPVSWIQLDRTNGEVTMKSQTCVFFVVPYSTQKVSPVVEVEDRFVHGKMSNNNRRKINRNEVKSEDQAFLKFVGPETSAEISVSPADIDTVLKKVDDFRADANATQLRLWVVANWKFGVIMGGLTSLLTVLWVVGNTLWILSRLWRLITWPVRAAMTNTETVADDDNKFSASH